MNKEKGKGEGEGGANGKKRSSRRRGKEQKFTKNEGQLSFGVKKTSQTIFLIVCFYFVQYY